MTSLSYADGAPRSSVVRAPSAVMVAVLMFAAGMAWELWIGLWGDVSWLLNVDERWFAGERLYVDLLETNPPASLFLYAPAVALAKLMGWRSDAAVTWGGFLFVACAIGFSAFVLRRAERLASFGTIELVAAIFAFLLLPGAAFMERDTMAATFALPYLALAVARADGRGVGFGVAILAGLSAGVAIAVKPPYALALALPALYALWRQGPRSFLAMVEIAAAGALLAGYFTLVAYAFPAYGENILPSVVNVYLQVRESALTLLFNESGRDFLLLALLGVYLVGDHWEEPAIAVSGLAALGAFVGYLVQGKGWLYQAYPAFAYATLFFALAWRRAGARKLDLALAAFAAFASLAIGVFVERWGIDIVLATLAALALRREFGATTLAPALARFAAAATLGACAAAFAPGPQPSEGLGRALAALKPHPTVVAISESFGYVHPMTRRVGAEWVQRTSSLLIASGARLLIDQHPGDAALKAKLEPYIRLDIDRIVKDIKAKRPDAIVVGPLDTRFHAFVWADPAVQAAMADYRRVAGNDDPAHPGELWARSPEPILRPGL